MRVAIRADAGSHIGLGHVMRCSRLAEELAGRGATVTFVTRTHPGHVADLLQDRGFDVITLTPDRPHSRDVGTWLGADPDVDAMETIRAIDHAGCVEWLVVDHYGISAAWHREARAVSRRVLVIDDLKDRSLDADIVLNQNLGSAETDYAGLVPPDARVLIGPRYALLGAEYATARAQRERSPVPNGRSNLLISVGGSDPSDATGRVLLALESVLEEFTRVDVVIGHHHPDGRAARARWVQHRNVRVHVQPPSLVDLLLTADLAIGAGGSSTWERMCLGVPTVMLVLAENQRNVARAVAEGALAIIVEDPWDANAGLRAQTLGLLEDAPRRHRMAVSGRRTVDGEGTRRVADAMEAFEP